MRPELAENIDLLVHSAIRIQTKRHIIYIDPFQIKGEPHDADLIFITHDHYDHYSLEDIAKTAKETTVLVIPETMADKKTEAAGLVAKIETVKQGVYRNLSGLEFDTIPAYNVHSRFHPKAAGGVGYLLRANSLRIYIAGDTDATNEAKQINCDIALVPVGGKYTMDAKAAADLVNHIRPRIAIPTHYGSVVGGEKDAKLFAKLVNPPVKTVIKEFIMADPS